MIGGQWYAVREAGGWSSVVTSNVYFGHTTVEMFLPDSSQQSAVSGVSAAKCHQDAFRLRNLHLTPSGADLSSPIVLAVIIPASSILQFLITSFRFFPSDTI